jgi:DNA-binding MarR family transcriptional regulator
MYDELYKSLFEIVSFFTRPRQDKLLLQKAGVSLDTALFPLLMRIAYYGSLGIVALAEQVDRDHSTVSRQVDKLIATGLISPVDQKDDKRVRKVALTDAGKGIVSKIAATRQAMMRNALQDWDEQQLSELHSGLEHLAETIRKHSK